MPTFVRSLRRATLIHSRFSGRMRPRAVSRCGVLNRGPTQSNCWKTEAGRPWHLCAGIRTAFSKASSASIGRASPIACERPTPGEAGSSSDPYAFGPVLGPMDDHLMVEGTHRRLYERLGAHPMTHEGSRRRAFRGLGAAMRDASPSSVISTAGMAAAIRCASASTAGCGRFSRPASARARSTSSRSSAPTAQLLPLKADPFGFAARAAAVHRLGRARAPTNFTWND